MQASNARIPVWDLPTRLFHWLFAAGFVCSWLSHELGATEWHFYSGYALLSLLIFRILWGLVGSRHSRFLDFWPRFSSIRQYLRNGVSPTPGHNPLGALSVFAMLSVMAVQLGSGLANADEAGNHAPYNAWASEVGLEDAAGLIHEWAYRLMLGLIGMHVCAVSFYTFVKHQRMIPGMITGYKNEAGLERPRHLLIALACLAVSVLLVWLVVDLWAPAAPTNLYF